MSEWEQRLRNLAEGPIWQMPNLEQTGRALSALTTLMDRVASETGFTGEAERAAVEQMQEAKSDINDLIAYVQSGLPAAVDAANSRREEAQRRLAALGAGSLSSEQQQTVRNAAAGATIFFGGFSIIAGEGAIAAANWFMGSQREDQAKAAVEDVSNMLDADSQSFPDVPQMAKVYGSIPNIPEDIDDRNWDVGGKPSTPSFQKYPDYDVPSSIGGPGAGGVTPPQIEGFPPYQPPGIDGPGNGGGIVVPSLPGIVPGGPGTIIVNPDGPISGGTGGGGIGTMPGIGTIGGGTGGGGGLGGGLGGGVSPGLIAGGGAAALGLGKAAAAGGLGRLGGAGGIGGAGGAGGLGAGRAGGLAGGGLTANAGGGAAGGLLGKGGGLGAGAGAAAAGEAGGARGGGMGMAGGGAGGAGGAGGGRSEKKGRGLGGPMAPKLEDDAEFGPRSEGAGAGGRD